MTIKRTKNLLLASALAVSVAASPANAAFTMRGIMYDLMNKDEAVICYDYTKWRKRANPKQQETMNQWILGFYSGLESQLTYKYPEATGSERFPEGIAATTNAFCKDFPKKMVLTGVWGMVEYDLEDSIKNHTPGYKPGFNVHGAPALMTCQNLTLETDNQGVAMGENRKFMMPQKQDRKHIYEEWMLAVATGIESVLLRGKEKITQTDNDTFLDMVYQKCRDNPAEYVFAVVQDTALAMIKLSQQGDKTAEAEPAPEARTASKAPLPSTGNALIDLYRATTPAAETAREASTASAETATKGTSIRYR